MRNIKLIIEYDGKKFGGWQKQPTKLNIQGEIEQAIKEIPLYIVYMFPINPSLSSLSNSVIAEMDQAL